MYVPTAIGVRVKEPVVSGVEPYLLGFSVSCISMIHIHTLLILP